MLNYTYQEYIEQNVALVKSLVIKYSQFADKINENLVALYGEMTVDYEKPETWKYYLNLAGKYHVTDKVMYIRSLDNLQVIEFNYENLLNNPFTLKNYYIGSNYYYRLLAEYPGQETVIRGILNPVDINVAINAENGSILNYDKTLVDPQEITLIQELNDYLITYYNRFKVVGYYHTDDLEPISFFAIMVNNAVSKLINLRLKRAKTPEANDYHIYYYLDSHSKLGQYICYLTTEQKLWLYRNVLYLEKHAGAEINLQDLIDNLVTKSFINISAYEASDKFSFDTNFLPEYTLIKDSINNKVNSTSRKEYTIKDYANRINDPIIGGTDIADYPINDYYNEDFLIQTSKFAENETKVLELSGVDYTDSYPTRYKEVLLYNWMNLVKFNKYTAYVYFKEPRTGNLLTISSEDALIFMFYLFAKYLDINLTTIQPVYALNVLRNPKATVDDLLTQVPSSFLNAKAIATDLVNNTDTVRIINSIEEFNIYATNIYKEHIRQFFVVANQQDMYHRGFTEGMVDRLYAYEQVVFSSNGENLQQWLALKGLTDPGYGKQEALNFAMTIFGAATGFVENTCTSYNGIKEAITNILRTMSSYSIQVINDDQNSKLLQIDWASIRTSRRLRILKGYNYIDEGVDVIDAKSKVKFENTLNLNELAAVNVDIKFKKTIKLEINNQIIIDNKLRFKNHVSSNKIGVFDYKEQGNFNTLTPAQQKIIFELF